MIRRGDRAQPVPALSEQLLLSIAEQLKVPFLQIARKAELMAFNKQHIAGESLQFDAHVPNSTLRRHSTGQTLLHVPKAVPSRLQKQPVGAVSGSYTSSHAAPFTKSHDEVVDGLTEIQTTADMAIRLLDNYLFGARLALEDQYQLQMEPVSISSVLYDTGQQLDVMAKLYGVELELSLGGKFGPVMAHRGALQSALVSLGYSLIEALPSLQDRKLRLQLAAHRCRYGIVTGLYSDVEQLTAEALRQGRKLYGHTRQPLATLTPTSGAGVFVADAILQAMDSELKVSRHHRLYGLGTVLRPNPQIQLV